MNGMAHIPTTAAIFSPSIARLASSAAKDWNYVDSWLSSKFPGRSPPPFERNPETLRALVALATVNENTDENCNIVSHAEAAVIRTLAIFSKERTTEGPPVSSHVLIGESVITAIENDLSPGGHSAVDSLASASVEMGIILPDGAGLGRRITELKFELLHLQRNIARMHVLQKYMEEQESNSKILLKDLECDAYRPPASLAKLNLELQRKVRACTARLQDEKERSSSLGAQSGPTVQQILHEEAVYFDLMAYKRVLEKQAEYFQGLSPDKELARQQVEALRNELQVATKKRDRFFESLVEKATPKKVR